MFYFLLNIIHRIITKFSFFQFSFLSVDLCSLTPKPNENSVLHRRCCRRRPDHQADAGGVVLPVRDPTLVHLPTSLHPTLRPWRELLSLRSFSLPYGYSDAFVRLRKNLSHFRFNYALIALLALFLSLIFHPYSLLLFVFLSLARYALYFSRDSPIVLFGRVFDDRVVAAVLGVVTIVGLVLTGVGLTVLVALVVAVVIVGVHGVFRNSEDLYVDEEGIGEGGLVSVVSSQPLLSYARIG